MNIRTLTLIVVTHAVVGAACFWLGSGTSEFKTESESKRSVAGNIKPAVTPSTHSAKSNVMAKLEQPRSAVPRMVTGSGVRSRVESALAAIANMNTDDVIGALRDIRYKPGDSDTVIIQQMILARYAELDPENAVRYATTLQGIPHEMALLTVMNTWTADNPKAAADHFEGNHENFSIEEDTDSSIAAGSIAAAWAVQDADAALTWVKDLPEEMRVEAYGRIIAELTSEDPARATAVVEAMPSGPERTETLKTLVDQWAHQDPNAAGDYLVDQPVGDEQRQAAAAFMKAWMSEAPLDASTWLSGLADSTIKDASIIGMTQTNLLANDPEANAAWSAAINDPTLRARAIDIAVTRWSATDPSAAQAWLQTQKGGGAK